MGAFTVPLRPDKVEPWKAFARELSGTRSRELEMMHARMGLTEHRAFLDESGPEAPRVIVIASGPGSKDFLARLTRSNDPFDQWFIGRISDLHDVDFRAQADSLPPPAEPWLDWQGTPTGA